MKWINSLFIWFKNWLASDLVAELKDRNAKLLKANGILYDKCNTKDNYITRINYLNKFNLTATIETKVRVWIRENEPLNGENIAKAKRTIALLYHETKEKELAWKSKVITTKENEPIKHTGLSKGFRRK